MGKNKILIVLVLIILVLGASGYFLYQYYLGRVDKLKVAKLTLSWLDKQKDNRGSYVLSKDCNITNINTCKDPLPSNRDGLSVIWGRFVYAGSKNGASELEAVKKDLSTYADKNKIPVIMNNFWNCKLMYDLWQSSLLSPQDKTYAFNICFDSYDDPSGISLNYLATTVGTAEAFNTLKESAKAKMKAIRNNSNFNNYIYNDLFKEEETILWYPYISSDHAARYMWKKLDLDLKWAYFQFDAFLEYFIKNERELLHSDKLALGINAVDLYKINNDREYLDFADYILNRYINSLNKDDIYAYTTVGFLANELFEVTKNVYYLKLREQALKIAIKNDFDYSGYSPLKGDGGFYKKYTDIFVKSTRYNGLMVGLLSKP